MKASILICGKIYERKILVMILVFILELYWQGSVQSPPLKSGAEAIMQKSWGLVASSCGLRKHFLFLEKRFFQLKFSVHNVYE